MIELSIKSNSIEFEMINIGLKQKKRVKCLMKEIK